MNQGRKFTLAFWGSAMILLVQLLITLDPRLARLSDVIGYVVMLLIAAVGFIAWEDRGRAFASAPATIQQAIDQVGDQLIDTLLERFPESIRDTAKSVLDGILKTAMPDPIKSPLPPSTPPFEKPPEAAPAPPVPAVPQATEPSFLGVLDTAKG